VKKLSNPKDLLVAVLSELLWVERRLGFDVLPEVIDAVHDSSLKELFEQHLTETREHVSRVEGAFRALQMEPGSAFSPGFSGLIEQHDTVAKKTVEPGLADRWHAAAGIAAEHFELALYTGVEALAPASAWEALSANVADERGALEELTEWLGRGRDRG
jgi:ferritin-like metal-binding protein YciE